MNMAVEVFLPRLTHDMKSGIFVRWLKAEGELVKPDEALYEVETDKAVTEVAASAGGVLKRMDYKEGDEILIGTVIAYLLAEGEELPKAGNRDFIADRSQLITVKTSQAASIENASPQPDRRIQDRLIATPIARRMARELNVDLAQIAGSGPQGRIIEADVHAYLSRHPSETTDSLPRMQEVPFELIPLSRIQLTTGQRMALSSQTIPQFTLEVDVDMSEAQRLRQLRKRTLWEGDKNPSYTAILIRVVARALHSHPRLNASLDGEFIRCYQEINLGVAVATPEGLLVPVIRKADMLRLRQIQEILDEIQDEAARGKIKSDHLSGGTFTVSNLGMFGIDRFQAIINPPEAAILAAGRIRELPWATSEGVQVRPILTLRLSCDHRLLDGATAAPFLMDIKNLLENPYELL